MTTLVVPERIDEIPNILDRIRRGERVDHYETERRTKDGGVLNVSLTVSPVRNAAGKVIGASKVARGVTDRKRSAAQNDHRGKKPSRNVAVDQGCMSDYT